MGPIGRWPKHVESGVRSCGGFANFGLTLRAELTVMVTSQVRTQMADKRHEIRPDDREQTVDRS